MVEVVEVQCLQSGLEMREEIEKDILVRESPTRSPLKERTGSEQRPSVMRRAKSPTFDYDSGEILVSESQLSQTPPPTL